MAPRGERAVSTRGHVLILVVTLCSLVFVVRLLRRSQLAPRYAVLWMSVGTVMLLMASFPGTVDRFSVFLGISYGPATVFLGAITVLFVVVVHFSWELSRLEERTQILAQEVALLRAENEEGAIAGG
jgi:hypothetical protein